MARTTDNATELRVTLVGLSKHAREELLPALRQLQGIDLSHLVSTDKEKLEAYAYRFGAKYTHINWREVLTRDISDTILVAGPPQLHADVMEAALENEVSVFVEKPCAPHLDAIRYLASCAESKASVKTFVGYNYRFSEPFQSLLSVLNGVGPVSLVKIQFLTNKPRSILWDLGSIVRSYLYAIAVHPVDLAINLLGPPDNIVVAYHRLNSELFSMILVLKRFTGQQAILELGNYSNRFRCRYEIVTENGATGVLTDHTQFEFTGLISPDSELMPIERGKQVLAFHTALKGVAYDRLGYTNELRSFFHSVITASPSASPVQSSVLVHEVLEEAIKRVKHPV
jgi:phthalate 4,5-cis-dihydrodiol dehydrogenase